MKIIIADAAVSLVPQAWLNDVQINSYFNKFDRLPLVDASIHQHLIKKTPISKRLDRPDILHFGLLTVLGYTKFIPDLDLYFTIKNQTYHVSNETNLPRSQKRFYGLIEKLLNFNKGSEFINLSTKNPLQIPNKIVFSSKGNPLTQSDLNHEIFVFGGFARGSYEFQQLPSDKLVQLNPLKLELWTAISRFLNLYIEKYSSPKM